MIARSLLSCLINLKYLVFLFFSHRNALVYQFNRLHSFFYKRFFRIDLHIHVRLFPWFHISVFQHFFKFRVRVKQSFLTLYDGKLLCVFTFPHIYFKLLIRLSRVSSFLKIGNFCIRLITMIRRGCLDHTITAIHLKWQLCFNLVIVSFLPYRL